MAENAACGERNRDKVAPKKSLNFPMPVSAMERFLGFRSRPRVISTQRSHRRTNVPTAPSGEMLRVFHCENFNQRLKKFVFVAKIA
jgi:hypothetical protein